MSRPTTYQCGNCGAMGHNRRSCPQLADPNAPLPAPVPPAPPRAPKRVRGIGEDLPSAVRETLAPITDQLPEGARLVYDTRPVPVTADDLAAPAARTDQQMRQDALAEAVHGPSLAERLTSWHARLAGPAPAEQDAPPVSAAAEVAEEKPDEKVRGDAVAGTYDPYPWAYGTRFVDSFAVHGPALVAPYVDDRGPYRPVEVTAEGVYQLEHWEYHGDPVPAEYGGSMSNSDGRLLYDGRRQLAPAQFRYDRDHGVRQQKDAFDFGSVWHRLVLGAGQDIVVVPYANWRKDAAQEMAREARAAGAVPILEKDYQVAADMAEAMRDDEDAGPLLARPARYEAALFWQHTVPPLPSLPGHGPIQVIRRAALDQLPTGVPWGERMLILDIKSTDDAAPGEAMERRLYDHGYHRAAATYVDAVTALGLAAEAVLVLAYQSKRPPYLVSTMMVDGEAERIGRIENSRALEVFAECTTTGVWPKHTRGIETIGVPAHVARKYQM